MLIFDAAVPGLCGLCPACLVKPPQGWRCEVNLFKWHSSAEDFSLGFLPTSMCKCHGFALLDFTSSVQARSEIHSPNPSWYHTSGFAVILRWSCVPGTRMCPCFHCTHGCPLSLFPLGRMCPAHLGSIPSHVESCAPFLFGAEIPPWDQV